MSKVSRKPVAKKNSVPSPDADLRRLRKLLRAAKVRKDEIAIAHLSSSISSIEEHKLGV